jgi:hypothetical protein
MKLVSTLSIEKVDNSKFDTQVFEIKQSLEANGLGLDKNIQSIRDMESFVDKYFPISILKMIRESMGPLLNRKQTTMFEKFEREKFRDLNRAIIADEERPEILSITKKLLNDVSELI